MVCRRTAPLTSSTYLEESSPDEMTFCDLMGWTSTAAIDELSNRCGLQFAHCY